MGQVRERRYRCLLSGVGMGSVVWVWAQWCGNGLSGVGTGSVVLDIGQADNLLLRLCCGEAHLSYWEQHDLL